MPRPTRVAKMTPTAPAFMNVPMFCLLTQHRLPCRGHRLPLNDAGKRTVTRGAALRCAGGVLKTNGSAWSCDFTPKSWAFFNGKCPVPSIALILASKG